MLMRIPPTQMDKMSQESLLSSFFKGGQLVSSFSGANQDKLLDAKDHLQNLQEEYLQDVTENEYMQQYVRKDNDQKQGHGRQKQSNGFVVKGAPWEAPPDTQSTVDFPTFGNGLGSSVPEPPPAQPARPLNSVWGRKH